MPTRIIGPVDELIRFGFVGATTAAIFYVTVTVGAFLGVRTVWMTALAYCTAIVFQYMGHALFTFGRRVKDAHQILRFGATNAAGLVFSIALIDWLGPSLDVDTWIVAGFVVVALPLFNYAVFRAWAFAKKPDQGTCLKIGDNS